ncbi:tol-pal system protein YbgF [Roseiarcus fermentans]|uniref:Cell division coordinator CpoB n=1 Tax=Roseiarcus fermentans TaxID=1473586 RepID=A0A366EYG6_9HYPH|nr:tol-pal system protein YbgF [Roseiarcus fermentans]RBP07438.1 tol-pal system protein YbgF [Roseiarcus fermentans]
MSPSARVAILAAFAGLAAASPAGAQGFDFFHRQTVQSAPPAEVPGQAAPEEDQTAALLLRVNRLEDQLRQANGRIEELENAERRLEDQLQKFRQDVEFRFGERSGAPAAAAPAAPPSASAAAAAPPAVMDGSAAPRPRRSDAFDPSSDPGAPGAPRPLGTSVASPPPVRPAQAPPAAGPPLELGGGGAPAPATGPTIVGSGVAMLDAPRDQYNAAVQAFQGGQYQQAEDGFKAFMAANPGHRLTPDAVFFIGETYFQRSRPREAAEQYLKVTTDYAKSGRAAESLVRLGQALAALGNKDQACATFAELGKRYPTASPTVKRLADREMAKNHC